jgi:predicted PurR-regulated permease PerM
MNHKMIFPSVAEPPKPTSDKSGKDLGRFEDSAGGIGWHPPGTAKTALVGLFVLALLYTLYFAQIFLVPIAFASVLAILLSPAVYFLYRCRVPKPIGAGLVVLLMLVAVGAGFYYLSSPAAKWMNQGPYVMKNLRFKMNDISGSLDKIRQAGRQLEEMTNLGKNPREVQIERSSLVEKIFTQVRSFSATAVIIVVLLYFFLAHGGRILQKLSDPETFAPSKGLYLFFVQVEDELSTYLVTITLINLGLGALTAAGLALIGLPNPVLWGVLAFLLNYIPYIGAAATLIVISIVALLTFDSWSHILQAPLLFLLLTALEGQVVTPSVVGRRLTINPILVLVSILFWGWIWGIAGAVLGVPFLAAFMVAAKFYKPLQPIRKILT